jgi:galactokinase
MNRVWEQLAAAGMSETEAVEKDPLFGRAFGMLTSTGAAGQPVRGYFVPGRIEVLGKHTDYAGGRSLLCTVERGFCMVARPRTDAELHVVNARSRQCCVVALDPDLPPADEVWCNYPATVARRLARNFPSARTGADIAFVSDLPAAAGMSSSSALMVSIYLALADLNALEKAESYEREIHNQEDLAGYLGTIENGQSFGALAGDRGVGTFGGSEDHTAILCSRGGELRQYSFCPIRHERTVRMPASLVLAIAVSGVAAIKTGAARTGYNRASLAARKVLELWHRAAGRNDLTIAAAAASAPDAPERMRAILRESKEGDFAAGELCDRFEQFHEESERIIPAATGALAEGDLGRFGALVDRSQLGAERLLGNQVPETIGLVKSARTLGAVAASAFGAGFGGSVWAMVPAERAPDFERQWAEWYTGRFPAAENARFFTTRPGPSALRLDIPVQRRPAAG